MGPADYRMMSEATGQRIAAALEALSGFGAYLTTADVVNNLTSTDPTKALAAPQGKALNDKFGGVQIVPVAVTTTLPDGTSSQTTTILDLSSFIPSGKSIHAISNIRMGMYPLPYVSNGNVLTYAMTLSSDNKLTIANKTIAWNDYPLRCILFCV